MKRMSRITCLLVAVGFAMCFGLAACGKNEDAPAENPESEFTDFVVEVESGRDPVILQLTDPQIIDASQERTESRLDAYHDDYWAKNKLNARCYDYIREIIRETKPDLIIMTGDIVYGEFDDAGTALISFINFMESFNIPWAPVFGNHENESKMGVDWQCSRLEKAKNCLFKQRTLTGNGNYTVGIKQNEVLTRVFYMLDSNGCGAASNESMDNGHTRKTPGFGDDQISWYTEDIAALKEISPATKISFAFHIQPQIFADAFAKYGFPDLPINIDTADDKAESDFGYMGATLKTPWDANRKVWNGIKALGVDSIFVGHEHCNSGSVVYEGVRLQYGQKSSTYDRANYLNPATGVITGSYNEAGEPIIGGTVFTLSEADGTISSPHIYYCNTTRPRD